MKLLLHTCCAPCFLGCFDALRCDGLVAYFYNPNIHPFREFAKRLRAMEVSAERYGVELVAMKDYGLEEFLGVVGWGEGRCERCYRLRLERSFELAHQRGFDAITTTLLSSPYQRREAIQRIGGELGERWGIEFLMPNLTGCHEKGVELARRFSLYRQQYCGCIFSEYERFGGKAC